MKSFLLNQIDQEKIGREENERVVYDMMKEVVEKMKDELNNEQSDRVKMENIIKGILDEISNRLNILTHQ